MGLRGPKPLPRAIIELRGNPHGRSLSNREPRPRIIKPENRNFRPPLSLNDDGMWHWRDLSKKLARMGVLTEADGHALYLICRDLQDLAALDRLHIKMLKSQGGPDYGVGVLIASKDKKRFEVWNGFWARKKLHESILKGLREFGGTASARRNIEIAGKDKGEDYGDSLLTGEGPRPCA